MSDPGEVVELRQDDAPEPRRGRKRKPLTREQRDRQNAYQRRRRAEQKAAGRPSPRRGRERDDLEAPLRLMFQTVGGFWHSVELQRYENHPDPTCGAILVEQSPAIAKALWNVAQDDESVYRWLSMMMSGGGWGAVAFAVLPVANAVISTHAMPALQSAAERRRRRAISRPEPVVFPESVEAEPENPGPYSEPEETWRPPNEIVDDEQ